MKTENYDLWPTLGSKTELPRHIQAVLNWAKKSGVLTIAHQLLGALAAPSESGLIGGPLAFLANRDSRAVLEAWSQNHSSLQALSKLAEALAQDFPALDVPPSSPPIDLQFRGQMARHYLAAQLSTRRGPQLSEDKQLAITCLRLWLLKKALEFHKAGVTFDHSINTLSTQIRMALDDRGDREKLTYFTNILEPALELEVFEQSLRKVLVGKADGQPSWHLQIKSAFNALLENRHRKDNHLHEGLSRTVLYLLQSSQTQAVEQGFSPYAAQIGETSIFLPDQSNWSGAEEYLRVPVNTTESPIHHIRSGNGIVLQGQEDRQYLPYGWNRPRKDEKALLLQILSSQLSLGPVRSLTAAIAQVAVMTRNSMETVKSLPLTSELQEGWSLDLTAGTLRRPASRRAIRWRANSEAETWISPLLNEWELCIPQATWSVLAAALRSCRSAQTVGDLWQETSSLAATFNQMCDAVPGLERISSGMLPYLSEQAAFENNRDSVFARLATAPPKAGISGAAAYPSWLQAEVKNSMDGWVPGFAMASAHSETANAMGSELDPDDELLATELGMARAKVDDLATKIAAWEEYHNALTTYVVTVLLACTGARPVRSLFESIVHFDQKRRRAYIDDKATPQSRDGSSGRVVPLPKIATDILFDCYLPYLLSLSVQLEPYLASFALAIADQSKGLGSTQIPLFFFLRQRPNFDWFQVSEEGLDRVELFSWPLPWNLFRHRMAARLRKIGLDAELIDAQLGHAEAGSETFGDRSARCWADEEAHWRDKLETAVAPLNMGLPAAHSANIARLQVDPEYQPFLPENLFGASARQKQRKANHKRARQKATEEIEAFLKGRPTDSISADEWEKLGRSMLLDAHNLPKAHASVRYQAFESFMVRIWKTQGTRPKFRTWLVKRPAHRSAFHPDSVLAPDVLTELRRALDVLFDGLQVTQTSRNQCGLLGALDLAANAGISNPEILNRIAAGEKKRFFLVIDRSLPYLEFSPGNDINGDTPVQRFLIPTRTARMLDRAFNSEKMLSKVSPDKPWLHVCFEACGLNPRASSPENLLGHVAHLVDQNNALNKHGLIAGVLSGRISTFSLHRHEWLRAKHGAAKIDPSMAEASRPLDLQASCSTSQAIESQGNKAIPIQRLRPPAADTNFDPQSLATAADNANRRFAKDVRELLTQYVKGGSPQVQGKSSNRRKLTTNADTSSRRGLQRGLEKLLKHADPSVSSSMLMLGAWTLHLVYRPFRQGLLNGVTVLRYFNALASGFITFGRTLDLADLDEDELTEFYSQVIDPALSLDEDSVNPDAEDSEEGETPHTNANESDVPQRRHAKRDQHYVLQRLQEFHRFAKKEYGLIEPLWSELSDGLTFSTASPGFITSAEYHHALRSLCSDAETAPINAVRDAFILMLTYRFGLRGGEANAIERRGWVESNGAIVVLVTPKHRSLKTRGSQRQVPLLGKLEDHETAIAQRWLSFWAIETTDNPSIPLFFEHPTEGGLADLAPIRRRLIAALRHSTRSTNTNLHHARHALANRLGLDLIVGHQTFWTHEEASGDASSDDARRLFLSSKHLTRRSLPATSRALGHSLVDTTCGSYLHFILDWHNSSLVQGCPALFPAIAPSKLPSATDLDTWPADSEYLGPASPLPAPGYATPTPVVVLRYMELRARGAGTSGAMIHLNLSSEEATRIEDALVTAGSRLAGLDPTEIDPVDRIERPLHLLLKILPDRWGALGTCLAAAAQGAVPLNISAPSMLSPARQILFWRKEHFEALRTFFEALGFNRSNLQFFGPKNLDDRVKAWAKNLQIDLLSPRHNDGKKIIQLDRAVEYAPSQPPVFFEHRVAMIRDETNAVVKDNYELQVVWLAFHTGKSDQGSSTYSG